MSLFIEQNILDKDRPEKISIKDKIEDLQSELEGFTNALEFINIEDCYDQIQIPDNYNGIYHINLTATNLLDCQVLEQLMELCFKYKNPIKVLDILNKALLDKKEFNWDSI